MEELKPPTRALPLFAAVISFVYHALLAILASYIPRDHYGASIAFWAYSWTACFACYFGIIAIAARLPLLSKLFAYCMFLDSIFSGLWRFAVLHYVIWHSSRGTGCHDLDREFHFPVRLRQANGRICDARNEKMYVVVGLGIGCVMVAELYLANVVRMFADRSSERQQTDPKDAEEKVPIVFEGVFINVEKC